MRIEIEIPKEFEVEFNADKFNDCFSRVLADMHCLCGNYEKETITMLIKAFRESKPGYDTDRVVEELDKSSKWVNETNEYGDDYGNDYISLSKAIEIVKQGGVNIRKDCECRHENGNCLKVGGFCTSVNDKHCEKMKQGGIADDVCEWTKHENTYNYKSYTHSEMFDSRVLDWETCPYCSKKIKVVE